MKKNNKGSAKRYTKNKKRMAKKRYHNMSKSQRQEEETRLRMMAKALLTIRG